MENKPKKSKALIITIIALILLLIAGYLIFKNRDAFGVKTSASIAKIFSPLMSSTNSKNLTTVQAPNSFFNSFAKFLGGMLGGNKGSTTPPAGGITTTPPAGGWTMDSNTGKWSFDPNGTGGWVFDSTLDKWIPPSDGSGTFNFPTVTVTANPASIDSGASSTISWTSTNAVSCDAGALNGTGTTGSFSTGALTVAKPYSVTCTSSTGLKMIGNTFVMINGGGGTFNFPTVTVTANPASIDSGASSTISWTSTNAVSCDAGALNGTGTTGSFSTGALTVAKPYSVTCTSSTGLKMIGNTFVMINFNGGTCPGGQIDFPVCSVMPGTGPDLIAGPVSPTGTTINTPTTLSSTITNIGGSSTVTNFSSFFTIERTLGTATPVEIAVITPVLEAKTGSIAEITYTFSTVGEYQIRACADKKDSADAGTVTESDEANNCGAPTTFTVTNSLPQPCLPDELLDTTVTPNKCIPAGACVPPKVINETNKTCEEGKSTACLPTELLDKTVTPNKCIPAGDCVPPNVVNATNKTCENPPIVPPNICLDIEQNPLTFTPEEKARLEVLLRQFYLISSTLRTSEDITTIYNEIDQQNNFIGQIKDLTTQCYAEVTPAMMTANNWVKHGNPLFTKDSGGTFPYTSDNTGYTDLSWIQGPDGPGCKIVSGYYYGNLNQDITHAFRRKVGAVTIPDLTTLVRGKEGDDCSTFNNFTGYGSCNWGDVALKIRNQDGQPDDSLLNAGCKWQDGVDLGSTERILNIW